MDWCRLEVLCQVLRQKSKFGSNAARQTDNSAREVSEILEDDEAPFSDTFLFIMFSKTLKSTIDLSFGSTCLVLMKGIILFL